MASVRQAAPTASPLPPAPSARSLVEAARALLGERPPSAISGRMLAERAGVNYGLIHRHFGSKGNLLARAFDEVVADVGRSAFGRDGLPIAMYVGSHEPVWRVLVHVVLDRAGFDEHRHRSPGLLRCIDAIRDVRPALDEHQAAAVAGLAMALEVGIPLHRPVLSAAVDVRPDDPMIDRLAERWIAGLYRGEGPLGADPAVAPTPDGVWTGDDPSTVEPGPASAVESGEATVDVARPTAQERLVAAGAELLTDRSPSAISGRQLAREAGVNYGLIHHYFGSKHEVLRQSLQLHRDRFFVEQASGDWPPRFFSEGDHPGYVRALTWSALDPELARAEQRYPVADRLVERLTSDSDSEAEELARRIAIFVAIAAQLAWGLLLPVIEKAAGADPRRLEPALAPLLRDLLADPMRDITIAR